MSNDKNQPTPLPTPDVDPTVDAEAAEEVKERFAKTKSFVRTHKSKLLLAGLVGAAAIAGRASAPSYDHVVAFEAPPEPEYTVDIDVTDTTA